MSGYRLLRVDPPPAPDTVGPDEWPLPGYRPALLGRWNGDTAAPDVNLEADGKVSRRHAQLHRDAVGRWWIEDLGSKHGTTVDGQPLERGEPRLVEPGGSIRVGQTTLLLAPPTWRRLRRPDGLVVDLGVVEAVNYALVHTRKVRVVPYLVVRNWSADTWQGGELAIAIAGWGHSGPLRVGGLRPGEDYCFDESPTFQLDPQLETLVERRRCAVTARLDRVLLGEPFDCWLLPHHEWSYADAHRLSVAAFVLPNHPLVAQATLEAAELLGADVQSPETALAGIYTYFATRWRLTYQLEPPQTGGVGQKLRLPHQVLLDPAGRRGEGTCIDLALLLAACLERLGHAPLLAILDRREDDGDRHALVGCWATSAGGVESVLAPSGASARDAPLLQRLRARAVWLDPTGCAHGGLADQPQSFAAARATAAELLAAGPLLFALDVAAARHVDDVAPLPFSGEPAWSTPVAQAIAAAEEYASAARSRVSTVPLLVGLLGLKADATRPEGSTRRIVAACGADPDTARAALLARLGAAKGARVAGGSAGAAPPKRSRNYRQVAAQAREAARAAGSPFVLEDHLLRALLATPSDSLDRALALLQLDRAALRAARDALRGGSASGDSSYSDFSELPSSGGN